jgi:hypothetical protein
MNASAPATPPATFPAFTLQRDAHGRWTCTTEGVTHPSVQVVRAFPLSAPEEDIAIVSTGGQELVFVARLDALDAPHQQALREALAEREFVPVIERIRSVSTFATPSTWQVDTDRGATELVLKVEEDIRRLPGARRLLVTSGSGVVFEIRDRHRMDRASQRLLERFL